MFFFYVLFVGKSFVCSVVAQTSPFPLFHHCCLVPLSDCLIVCLCLGLILFSFLFPEFVDRKSDIKTLIGPTGAAGAIGSGA